VGRAYTTIFHGCFCHRGLYKCICIQSTLYNIIISSRILLLLLLYVCVFSPSSTDDETTRRRCTLYYKIIILCWIYLYNIRYLHGQAEEKTACIMSNVWYTYSQVGLSIRIKDCEKKPNCIASTEKLRRSAAARVSFPCCSAHRTYISYTCDCDIYDFLAEREHIK